MFFIIINVSNPPSGANKGVFMKAVLLIATLFASTTVFSADGPFHLSCKFQALSMWSRDNSHDPVKPDQSDATKVTLKCDRGNFTLAGDNNSPCKAATHLAQYFTGARKGETVQIEGLTYEASGNSGLETRSDVVSATRAGTPVVFEAPTVLVHGQPKKCNTTHVEISATP